MTAGCHPKIVPRSTPGSPQLLTILLLLLMVILLVTPQVFAAGRVLFPRSGGSSEVRSEVRSGVRSEVRSEGRSGDRSEVRPGPGGSEEAFWVWRGSTRGQTERPRLLPYPSRRPLQGPPTRSPQRPSSRPEHRQNTQVSEGQPTGLPPVTPHRRPVLARLMANDDRLEPRSRPQFVSVPVVPAVTLEGLGAAPNAAAERVASPGDDGTSPSETASRPIGPPEHTPPLSPVVPSDVPNRMRLQTDDATRIPPPVSKATSAADSDRIGAGLEVAKTSSNAATSPVEDGGGEGGDGGGRGGGRGMTELVTNGDSGGSSSSSSTVITDTAPVSSRTNSALVTSQADVILVTSPTLAIDSGPPPVYYNNDVIGGTTVLERDNEVPRESRKLESPRDATDPVRVLTAIASLKGSDRHRHVNDVQDTKPDRARLVIEQHSCPKLGGNLTLECRVEAAKDREPVQKFWWAKRHFDYDDGRVRDELIAVDGRPFSSDKISVQTLSAGHQRLLASELTAEDAGLYRCLVSRQDALLRAEVTVLLCRR